VPCTIIPLSINGLYEIVPAILEDQRGFFFEAFNRHEFEAAGLFASFVQDNQSKSNRGVLRGLHFQKSHPQGKLVRVILGEVFDVAVDLRKSSPTFGQWCGVRLSGDLNNAFYLPPGFAHGFLTLSEVAIYSYKCTEYYFPEDQGGIRWDDQTVKIEWPDIGMMPIISAKDNAAEAFYPNGHYFNQA
jgi:dTDP-4-dehydrorhamnose 3,5-epimerase